jgi:hypothetical protein
MSPAVSGKYRLERRLGGGGMAEVFAGSTVGAEGFSRRVAIKRVLPGYSGNAAFAQMFIAEAQISSQLVHPNIVSVVDFDRDDAGQLFLVMELVDGKDLDTLLATGLLPFGVVIFAISEILRGLGFAHDLPTGSDMHGIVHRDVSPHNVLLSWEGAVKVSDFGIAKARAASEATASVFIKGKPAYMSPEQANGERLDGRSDLFAVGVILWEMLVGKRLFVGEDTRATLAQVLFGQIPRPRTLRPDIPRDLERVTMKLLERDLPARYTTAEQVIADLVACTDAPRAGREALIATLAERFPDSVPVRHSAARARSAGVPLTPVPGTIAAGGQSTLTGVPDGPLGPHDPLGPRGPLAARGPVATPVPTGPGLATLTSPPTGALAHAPRRITPIVITLLLFLLSAIGAFAIVSIARRPSAPSPRAGSTLGSTGSAAAPQPSGSASQSGSSAASITVPQHTGSASTAAPQHPDNSGASAAIPPRTASPAPDTSIASPVTGTAPHDATSPGAPSGTIVTAPGVATRGGAAHATPQSGAIDVQSGRAGVVKGSGILRVVAIPIRTVTIDGTSYGHTPLTITLKAGKHRVRLQNVEDKRSEVVSVTVADQHTITLERLPQ